MCVHALRVLRCIFIEHAPDKKRVGQLRALDCNYLRRPEVGMPFMTTYCWVGHRVLGYNMLSSRPMAEMPCDASCRPLYAKAPAAEVGEWRLAYREDEPEKSKASLGTMSKVLTDYKQHDIALALRRQPWSERCKNFARYREKKYEAQAKEATILKLKRAAAAAASQKHAEAVGASSSG